MLFGGNAFSGATDLIQSFGSGEARGHSVFYNMGQGLVAGPTQGFGAVFGKAIEDTPFASGPVDVALEAALGEYASGVGEIKLAYDFLTYAGSLAGCAAGIIHLKAREKREIRSTTAFTANSLGLACSAHRNSGVVVDGPWMDKHRSGGKYVRNNQEAPEVGNLDNPDPRLRSHVRHHHLWTVTLA